MKGQGFLFNGKGPEATWGHRVDCVKRRGYTEGKERRGREGRSRVSHGLQGFIIIAVIIAVIITVTFVDNVHVKIMAGIDIPLGLWTICRGAVLLLVARQGAGTATFAVDARAFRNGSGTTS